jgi:hypothetical protein
MAESYEGAPPAAGAGFPMGRTCYNCMYLYFADLILPAC